MPVSTYNQVTMPELMYGTAWKKDATTHLVEKAIDAGFTAIDTANQLIHYQEALVGEALLNAQKRGIKRENLFLQTKFTSVNGQDHRTPYDASASLTTQVNQSFESSLKHLHTDYLDSYVLHGPYYRSGISQDDIEVWQAIESHFNAGKTKIIGVSNVSADQLEELCKIAKVKPMVVQNRCYAVRGWDEHVRHICKREGIVYQGFSLLTANPHVLDSKDVLSIARRLSATPEQIVFAFALHVGMQPLTGTSNSLHMKQDLESTQIKLTADEVATIEHSAH